MANFSLSIYRGDTADIAVTVTRNDDPVDLTGAALTFTAKRRLRDANDDAVAQKAIGSGITVTSAADGEATIRLDPEDTEGLTRAVTLVCDLELIEADGRVTTVAYGTVDVALDVTATAS